MKKLIRKILKEDDWGWAKQIVNPLDDMSDELLRKRVDYGPIKIGGRGDNSEDIVYIGDEVRFKYGGRVEFIFTLEDLDYHSSTPWGGWGNDMPKEEKWVNGREGRKNWHNLGWLSKP